MNRIGVYTRNQQGDATIFQVVPGDGPKFWPLIGIGAAVLVLGFFSGVSVLLVLLIGAGCIALGWYDLRPIEHKTDSTFRVSSRGIEALGETFPKSEIRELTAGSGYDSDESLLTRIGAALARFQPGTMDEVTRSLRLTTTNGRDVTLAGGLNSHVAAGLLEEVRGVLDSEPSISAGDDEPAPWITSGKVRGPAKTADTDGPPASMTPMHPGDLLLREIEYGSYQLERATAAGTEFMVAVPFKDDLNAIIRFALDLADGDTLWFSKIADRGGPPVVIPESILESPGFAGR